MLGISPGDSRLRLCLSRAPPKRLNLTHATCPERRLNFMKAEFCGSAEPHSWEQL